LQLEYSSRNALVADSRRAAVASAAIKTADRITE
jgi:hypothetical protein